MFIIALFIIFVILYYIWTKRYIYLLSWKMSGPFALPLIGCCYKFIGKSHEDYNDIIISMYKTFEAPFRIWFGPKMYIFLSKPSHLQIVLNSPDCLNRDNIYNCVKFKGINEESLLTLPAKKWQKHRKYLNPCFNAKILQSYVPIFNKAGKQLVINLSDKQPNEIFDIYDSVSACTLDLICETTLGTRAETQNGHNLEYLHATNKLMEIITTRIFQPLYYSEFIFNLSKWRKLVIKYGTITRNFIEKILFDKSNQFLSNEKRHFSTNEMEDQFTSYTKPQIFIDQLLTLFHVSKIFTINDIIGHTGTNIAAGFETSALTMSYVVLMMAMHQNIQERAYHELLSVFRDHTDKLLDVDIHHFGQLEYLERVIKETLRLFPIIPYISRKVTNDITLDGEKIPKGVNVVVGIMATHHDPAIWGPKANDFDPDNFLPENMIKRHSYSFVPFSGGSRNCIGKQYSMIAMKIVLAHLLTSYKFTTNLHMDELRLSVEISLKLVNKHSVFANKR